MEFISTKGMTNDDAPEGEVLVKYLEPSWGYYSVEYCIAYYDNPNDYTDGNGDGWKHWVTGNKIKVLSYAHLPEKGENPYFGKTQKEFIEENNGNRHPNKGCVGI